MSYMRGGVRHYGGMITMSGVGDSSELTMAPLWMGTGSQYQWVKGACIDRSNGKAVDPKNCPPPTLQPVSSVVPAKPQQSWLESLFARKPAPAPGALPPAAVAGSFTTPLLIAGGVIGAIALISILRK